MKRLIRLSLLTCLIYLQSCGDGMIKNKDGDKSSASATAKIPVPDATDNLIIKNEKDLTGYWVGFEIDTSNRKISGAKYGMAVFSNKINFSIDEVNDEKVTGHCMMRGVYRPFNGVVQNDGSTYRILVKETGGDKYSNSFTFSIAEGDSVLVGTSEVSNSPRAHISEYVLNKMLFHYNSNWKLEEGRFIDWSKKSAGTYHEEDGTAYTDTAYVMTSGDEGKYNASSQLLTKDEVSNMKKPDILVLRNSIFARHGYAFKKPGLRTYFDQQDWYIPLSTDVTADLTPLEKKNIELLMRYEKNAKEYYNTFGR